MSEAIDVVLPAACAYEKSGTFINTSGDLQIAGPKSDLEIIVRIAQYMGYNVENLSVAETHP